jgi:hypothetical protein
MSRFDFPHPVSLMTAVVLTLAACSGTEGPQGPAGPAGPTGPSGPSGPAGTAGSAGVSGLQVVSRQYTAIPPAANMYSVTCPAGKRVIAGGHAFAFIGNEVGQSYPFAASGLEGWAIATASVAGVMNTLTVYAICANAGVSGASALLPAPAIAR